jgi:preprotein translocase subunit SecF
MNIDMNDGISAYQIRKERETKHSLGLWLIVIVFGVFLGNMGAWGTQKGIEFVILQQTIKEMNKQASIRTQISNAKSQEQRKLNAAQAKQRNIELQKKQAGLRQALETCNFWRLQVARENTSANRINRDQSCNLANQFR